MISANGRRTDNDCFAARWLASCEEGQEGELAT